MEEETCPACGEFIAKYVDGLFVAAFEYVCPNCDQEVR